MRTKFAILALVALSFASCNKNEEIHNDSNFPADGVIRVATSVNGLQSRAGATTDNLAELGLCVTNPNSTPEKSYTYNNIRMTKSDGTWSSASIMVWQNSTQAVDIVAYAPYQSTVAYTTTTNAVMNVQADQSATDQSGIIASDFLGVRKTGFIPEKDLVSTKINLDLLHLMSKINFTITLGTELNTIPGTTTNPITGVAVNGTQLKGLCNFTTMAVTPAATNNAAVAVTPLVGPYTAGAGITTKAVASYEVILVPQTVAANGFSVSFTINNKVYAWTSPDAVTLANGTQYALSLTAGKDIVTLDGFTASDWTNGAGGSVETE